MSRSAGLCLQRSPSVGGKREERWELEVRMRSRSLPRRISTSTSSSSVSVLRCISFLSVFAHHGILLFSLIGVSARCIVALFVPTNRRVCGERKDTVVIVGVTWQKGA